VQSKLEVTLLTVEVGLGCEGAGEFWEGNILEQRSEISNIEHFRIPLRNLRHSLHQKAPWLTDAPAGIRIARWFIILES